MTTCEPCDVPGVLPGVIGTEQSRSWVVSSYAQAGTLLLAVPPLAQSAMAENHFEPQVFLWLRFFKGVFRVSGSAP